MRYELVVENVKVLVLQKWLRCQVRCHGAEVEEDGYRKRTIVHNEEPHGESENIEAALPFTLLHGACVPGVSVPRVFKLHRRDPDCKHSCISIYPAYVLYDCHILQSEMNLMNLMKG